MNKKRVERFLRVARTNNVLSSGMPLVLCVKLERNL